MIKQLSMLIVDDEFDTLEALKMGLKDEGLTISTADSRGEAILTIKKRKPDILITDLRLKDGNGLDVLRFIQKENLDIPVIIITAFGSVETAIEAIRCGAYDYILKPFRLVDIKRIITRLKETITLRLENEQLKQRLKIESGVPLLIGVSPAFQQIVKLVKQIASSRATVLITGETGTGKDVVAQTIHSQSPRYEKALITIDCGSIPESLLESELFGYEAGAFTGAVKSKTGKIELGHEGTLFLDEIGELPFPMQVKLLRVLQRGEFERLGGTTTKRVDVRIIAATNSNLEKLVEQGKFREDLFYRLNVISITMPPLRERLEDIPLLVSHFIDYYNRSNDKFIQGIDAEVLQKMLIYPWRGNIRELENMVERAIVLCRDDRLKMQHFPLLSVDDPLKNISFEIGMSLPDIERKVILQTLNYCRNDKHKTAKILQIGLATLYRKIKQYGLE